jgi:uncharacterized protein (UPF0303 family)
MTKKEELLKDIERYQNQEKVLQFQKFTHEDALSIGLIIAEYGRKHHLAIAIDIAINGYQVFRYGLPGTTLNNDLWLKRKIKTVNTLQLSTLHVNALLELNDQRLKEDWLLDDEAYASVGGGFPIHVKDTGVIGSICVSGRPHKEDHQIIIEALSEYLKVKL